MLRKFRVCLLSLLFVLFAWVVAGLQGCSLLQPKEGPKPLSSKEIYELVTANDGAPGAEVAHAQVLAQGVYRSARSATMAPRADGCPNARYLLVQRGPEITAELGRWIGFEFVLNGGPEGLENADSFGDASASLVPLTLLVRHPPYRNPVTGQIAREEISQFSACLERTGFAVWRMTSDWELVSGQWECELQSGGNTLATVRFLVRGEFPPLPTDAQEFAESFQGAAGELQPAPTDLTVALDPQLQAGPASAPSGQESSPEVVDFSANKVLAKWVPVPGGRAQPLVAVKQRPAPYTAKPPAKKADTYQNRIPTSSQAPALAQTPAQAPPRYQAQERQEPVVSAEPLQTADSLQGHPGVVVVVSSNQYVKSARNDALALRAKGYPAFIGQYKDPRTGRLWHTVRLEGYSSVAQAREAKRAYIRREGRQAFVAVRGSVPNPVNPPSLVAASSGPARPVALPSETAYESAGILPPPMYNVQVGACLLPESAQTMKRELESSGYAVRIVLLKDAGGKLWHRVLIGNAYVSQAQARAAVHAYKARTGNKAYVIDKAGRVVRK